MKENITNLVLQTGMHL